MPAHWVENAKGLEPQRIRDFSFTGLSFVGRDVGWFVGSSNLLQLSGGKLELFLSEDLRFTTVKAIGPYAVLVSGAYLRQGGETRSFGVIVHGDQEQWTADNLSTVPLNDWSITELDATDQGLDLALTDDTVPGDPPAYPNGCLERSQRRLVCA